MTPTPEQVAAWAREAGIPDVVQATNPPAFERFAALACAWQAEKDIDLVAMYGGPVDLEAAIRASVKGTT